MYRNQRRNASPGGRTRGPGEGAEAEPVWQRPVPGCYTDFMSVETLVGAGLLGAALVVVAARWWIRRRRLARMADQLLEEVLRHKDGFRR